MKSFIRMLLAILFLSACVGMPLHSPLPRPPTLTARQAEVVRKALGMAQKGSEVLISEPKNIGVYYLRFEDALQRVNWNSNDGLSVYSTYVWLVKFEGDFALTPPPSTVRDQQKLVFSHGCAWVIFPEPDLDQWGIFSRSEC